MDLDVEGAIMQFVVFWNINWLKQRLRKKPLSGRETYLYTLCWLALLTLGFFLKAPMTTFLIQAGLKP